MKVECSVEKIKNASLLAERITGKNLTLPALASILILATGKSIKIRATNLSLGIEVEIPAKIEKEGVVSIQGGVYTTLLSNLSGNGTVILEEINGNLQITSKTINATVKCTPHEDFPTLPVVSGTEVVLPVGKLLEGLKSVMFAGAISDIKPEISAVYIYPDNDNIVFVATDSFRLAEKKIKVKQVQDFLPILIPIKNAVDIVRTLQEESGDITVVIGEHQAAFIHGGIYVTTRLINGNFPDYRQIIPKNTITSITVLKGDLERALRVSNIFSDKFNQITLSVNPSMKECILYSKNTDIGEQKSVLTAALTGNQMELSVNFKYLHDSFQSLIGDSVAIECAEPNRPIRIHSVGDTNFLYLVMPMSR